VLPFGGAVGKGGGKVFIANENKGLAFLKALTPFAPLGLVTALLMATGGGIAHWMHTRHLGMVSDLEVLDFLQVAANASEGKGFTTLVLRPLVMTPQTPLSPVPDLYHPPLPLFVWGAMFAVLGHPSERASAYLAGLFLGLTAAFLALAAARVASYWGAFVTVGLFFTAPVTLLLAGLGHPIALGVCLFTIWFVTLIGRPIWTPRFAAFSGVLLGLTAMAQGLALLAVPAALVSHRWQPPQARWVFAFVLSLLLLPYAIRNWRWAGHSFSPLKAYALLRDTRPFPGDSIYRHPFDRPPSPFRLAWHHLPAILHKSRANLRHLLQVGESWGWLVVIGVGLSLTFWRHWAREGMKLPATLIAVLLPLVSLCLLTTRIEVFAAAFLLPLACFLTAMTGTVVAQTLSLWRGWQSLFPSLVSRMFLPTGLSGLLGLLLLAGQGQAAVKLARSLTQPTSHPSRTSALLGASLVAPEGGLAADEPRWLALYWRRPLLWMPCHQRDWVRLRLNQKISHLWVSPTALLQVGGDADRALRLTLVAGQPFLNRFYPIALPTRQALILTPFLTVTAQPIPEAEKVAERQSLPQLLNRIERALGQREFATAERLALAAVRQHPSALTFFTLGSVWQKQGRWLDALRAYQAALGEAPTFSPAANDLAWVYLNLAERQAHHPQGNVSLLQQAEQWANHALRFCPDDPKTLALVLDTAGRIDFALGRTRGERPQVRWRLRRALKRLHQAYQLLPDHPDILYHLRMVYTELGRPDLAQRYLPKKLETLGQEKREAKQGEDD
jgi:tetratricopeptide (TPR) repeat protein